MTDGNNNIDPKKIRILFMGSPNYAAVILKALTKNQFNICSVVSQPDKRVGRGKKMQSPAVIKIAREMGLPCYQPEKLTSAAVSEILDETHPELIVVAAYGKILRKDVLEYPAFGCINVHASLLPRWRGASPVHAAILHGDQKSGVTIMKMDEGIDTGDILSMRSVNLSMNETTKELTMGLASIGADLLIETLPGYLYGSLAPQKQPEQGATYAGMINKRDGIIDFYKRAEEIDRMVRAYTPWPTAYFYWEKKLIKLFEVNVLDSKILAPGVRGILGKYPCIGTGDFDIRLSRIQVPGKNIIDGKMFLNGARNWDETNEKNESGGL